MNQETKNKTNKDHTKIGAVIVLIISAIVFIPFGGEAVFEAFFNRNKAPVLGSYDGTEIRYEHGSTFANAVSNIAEYYKSMGAELNDTDNYRVFQYAFQTTVKDMAYLDAVKKAGYSVPESAVNRRLVRYYSDADGNYSPRLYNQTSKSDREEIRKGYEKTLAYNRVEEDLLGSDTGSMRLYGLKPSSKEAPFLSDMGRDTHSFSYVSFSTTSFPTEEGIKWAKSNADKFIKYNMSVVTLADESSANSLLKQLKSGEMTFADAVSEKSQKFYSGDDGTLSRPYAYQLENIITDADQRALVVALAKDELSPVINTAQGFSIFRGEGSPEQPDYSDSTMQNVIMSYVKNTERGYIEEYYTGIAKNFIAQATLNSFDEAALAFGVTKRDTLSFPVNYKNSSFYTATPATDEVMNDLAYDADALQKVFALKADEVSAPFVLGNNIVVMKCTGITKDSTETDAAQLESKIASTDQNSADRTLLASDKVKDNVWLTYYTQIVNLGD